MHGPQFVLARGGTNQHGVLGEAPSRGGLRKKTAFAIDDEKRLDPQHLLDGRYRDSPAAGDLGLRGVERRRWSQPF